MAAKTTAKAIRKVKPKNIIDSKTLRRCVLQATGQKACDRQMETKRD